MVIEELIKNSCWLIGATWTLFAFVYSDVWVPVYLLGCYQLSNFEDPSHLLFIYTLSETNEKLHFLKQKHLIEG